MVADDLIFARKMRSKSNAIATLGRQVLIPGRVGLS
jgi:hypothetical protein